jgi:hypothetical protein
MAAREMTVPLEAELHTAEGAVHVTTIALERCSEFDLILDLPL